MINVRLASYSMRSYMTLLRQLNFPVLTKYICLVQSKPAPSLNFFDFFVGSKNLRLYIFYGFVGNVDSCSYSIIVVL